jgi:penicillin-binding protein 2
VVPTTPAGVGTARLRLTYLITGTVFAVLVLRLWYIQFVRGSELQTRAAANRFVAREIEADRGVLYDSAGRQVVLNRPRFTVSVVTAALPEDSSAERRVLEHLATVLDIPLRTQQAAPSTSAATLAPAGSGAEAEAPASAPGSGASTPGLLTLLRAGADGRPPRGWQGVPIARNVPRDVAFQLMEESSDLPGVIIGEAPVREYPAGPTLAHILGFTGSIPEADLGDYRQKGYQIYDVVGRDGLEATYEDALRGTKGRKWAEVDAMGRELRTVGDPEPAVPGNSLYLTLDLDFQSAAEEALVAGLHRLGARSGAVVALDPNNGAIRALVSWPTFDNNMFSTGASPAEFAALLSDPNRPLVDRAISGQYAPGSTFKMITASAGLQEGVIGPKTRIFDPGLISLPNQYDPSIKYPFTCWLHSGHGSLNVVGAIANSCDVFFYEVAGGYFENGANQAGLGSRRLGDYARAFGLGTPTGVELLGESAGRVPSPEWLAENRQGEYWGTGQTYIMGIGQGYLLTTPLQMANVAAAVANGGTLYRPHLVDRIVDAAGTVVAQPGAVLRHVSVAPEYLALVREGMRSAVDWGTANRAWTHLPAQLTVGGKTGTAEFCDWVVDKEGGYCRRDRDGHLLTHAWFVAFAPVDKPQIVVAAFVDGSGMDRVMEGSMDAAPIAAQVFRAWFHLPEPSPPTPTAASTGAPGQATAPSDR